MHTIEDAVAEPDSRVRLKYSDGKVVIFDVAPLIRRGGVYRSLGDPDVFARVSVGERGRFIEWPGNIDFCADALRMAAEERRQAVS